MRPHRRTESSRSTCRAPGPDRGPTRVASEKPSAASRSTNVSSNSGHSNVPCASRRSRTSVSTMHAKASRLKSFRGLLRPMELARHKLFIGGRWVEPSTGEYVHDVDPATNQPIAEVAAAGPEDSKAAVEAARAAFEGAEWRDMDSSKRGRLLFQLGQSVRDAFEDLATLESLDVGKPIREAKGDVAFAYKTLEYWAGFADKIQGETIPVPGNRLNYTVRVPVGVTLHIAPWNYPLTLAVRGIAPALAAGNTVVAKPAQLTPLTLLRFAELAEKAGLPPGVLNVVTGPGSTVGKALAGHPRARREESQYRVRGRGPREGGQGRRVRCIPERGPYVLGGISTPRARVDPRGRRPQGRGPRRQVEAGPRREGGHADGSPRVEGSGRERPFLRRGRGRGGRESRGRRREGAGGRTRRRELRYARTVRRSRAGHADRTGGDLRTRPHRHGVPDHGRSHRDRQRRRVWIDGGDLDEGPEDRARGRGTDRSRHGVDQRVSHHVPADSVRRLEGQRLGARAGPGSDPVLHAGQECEREPRLGWVRSALQAVLARWR